MITQLRPGGTQPASRASGPVVIYDSGVGGLTVARHIMRLCPGQDLIYVADNAWFPYGNRRDLALRGRVFALLSMMLEDLAPQAIVIACNTASTAVASTLDDITEDTPIFTVFPPVEQTLRAAGGGPTALLATPSTIRRAAIRRVAAECSISGQLSLVPTMGLVHLAERKLAGRPVSPDEIIEALDPVIGEREREQIEGIVLGCTHFPWLVDELRSVFTAAHCWGDPALEVATRVSRHLGSTNRTNPAGQTLSLLLTSDHNQDELRPVFARHGFSARVPAPLSKSA